MKLVASSPRTAPAENGDRQIGSQNYKPSIGHQILLLSVISTSQEREINLIGHFNTCHPRS